MYDNGKGVPKDVAKAVHWYQKAAEQGHARAQIILAVMYTKGERVPKDAVKAMEWYQKAAEQECF
ncbi:MAG: sel1 repeat family protein [Nitrosospira sp.]|nr:sel1 repeat family protein [Nitrosospira sp.]